MFTFPTTFYIPIPKPVGSGLHGARDSRVIIKHVDRTSVSVPAVRLRLREHRIHCAVIINRSTLLILGTRLGLRRREHRIGVIYS